MYSLKCATNAKGGGGLESTSLKGAEAVDAWKMQLFCDW